MLKVIAGTRPLAFERSNMGSGIIISVYSGPRPVIAHRDWRFNTGAKGIRGAYLERWLPLDEARRQYYLERSYLHLYRQASTMEAEVELVALHCDPNEPDDSGELTHAPYKRGPHIHIEAATDPLPRAHFALNMANLPSLLTSAEAMTQAMSCGMEMVRDQVLDVFDHWA